MDQIWKVYDTDCSGTLDLEETKKFMKDYLKDVGMDLGGDDDEEDEDSYDSDAEPGTNAIITQMFRECDKDGSGEIDKSEMIKLIKGITQGKKSKKKTGSPKKKGGPNSPSKTKKN